MHSSLPVNRHVLTDIDIQTLGIVIPSATPSVRHTNEVLPQTSIQSPSLAIYNVISRMTCPESSDAEGCSEILLWSCKKCRYIGSNDWIANSDWFHVWRVWQTCD